MAQKIGQAILTGTGIAGLMSAGALVFNNNKTIVSNERMHAELIQAQNESNHLELDKFELAPGAGSPPDLGARAACRPGR